MKRIALVSTISAALLLAFTTPAFADHVKDVLGEQTSANEIVFPPVTAGTGLFLPDSPLYFLDKAFQDLKLSAALTPERKAETRNLIIGERLAELRVMAQRNNAQAIQNILNDITLQSEKMANEMADAAAQGKNVGKLAKDINDSMRLQRDVLKSVSEQASEPLSLNVQATSQSMLLAKVKIEEHLSEQEMLEAMDNDLEEEVETQVLGVETSLSKLEKRLSQLDKSTRKIEAKMEKKESDAQFRARMKTIKDQRKKLLEEIKRKKVALKAEQQKKLQDAVTAARRAREAARLYKNTRNADGTPFILTPTVTPTSTVTQ